MILSYRHRFIFIKTSKTAGTSIEIALEPICGEDDICAALQKHPDKPNTKEGEEGYRARNHRGRFPIRFNPDAPLSQLVKDIKNRREGRRYYNHMSAFEIRARAGADVFERYFKFCFERNPWDKAVSAFFWEKDRIKGVPQDFETYVQKRKLPSRFDLYTMGGKLAVDFVGKFENLEEDYRKAMSVVGVDDPPPLPRAKGNWRPRDKSYRDYYNEVSRKAVARQFAREIDLLGYVF
jgi:hypothetical protein